MTVFGCSWVKRGQGDREVGKWGRGGGWDGRLGGDKEIILPHCRARTHK